MLERFVSSVAVLSRALRNQQLRRVLLPFFVFGVAEEAVWIALLVYAFGAGGPQAVGLISLVQLIPASLLAPFGAILGDRFPRNRVLMVSYLSQGIAFMATGLSVALAAPLAVTYVLAAIANSSLTLTRSTQSALLPLLSETPEELTSANASVGIAEAFAIFGGPLVAGIVLLASTPGAVLLLSGVGLVACAAAVLTIRLPAAVALHPIDAGGSAATRASGIRRDLAEGFRAIVHEPGVGFVVGISGVQGLAWGAVTVLSVDLALSTLHMGESGPGVLAAALGVGGIVGASASVMLIGRRRLAPALVVGVIVWGAPIALLGFTQGAVVALVLLMIGGGGWSLFEVTARTLLQRLAPDEVLSRVFGVLEGSYFAAWGLGSILAPLLLSRFGIQTAFVIVGLTLPVSTAVVWGRLMSIDRVGSLPGPGLSLIRRMQLFAPMSPPELETVSHHLIPFDAAVGRVIVKEGDEGDLFYVIAEGEADVTVGGRAVAVLESGDHFGEIALLRDVPRTATVSARTALHGFVLARDQFLAAVTGSRPSVEAADSLIAERLRGLESSE